MNKRIASTLCGFFLLLAGALSNQAAHAEVTDQQWKTLLSAVNDEEWAKSYKISEQLLKDMPDSDDRLPRLRYIYLYTAAGDVSIGKMTFESLNDAIKPLIGKNIVFPYRQLAATSDGHPLNFITPVKEDKKKLFSAACNQNGTTIHAFEYITLKDDFDVASHDGQPVSICGVVDNIQPNPNKSRAIVLRLFVKDATLALLDKKDFHPTHKPN
jgi:hypothetical protein